MQNNKFNSIIADIDINYIIEYMPGYIYWKDLNSTYLACNWNLAKYSDLGSPKDIIGKTDYDFEWGIKQAAQFIQDDQFVIKTGEIHISEHMFPVKNQLGLNYVIRTEKRPLIGKSGRIMGILGMATDITAEREAARLKIEIERHKASEAKNNLSKDFTTQLLRLINQFQILNDRGASEFSSSKSDIKLTKRETEILYFLSRGKKPKEIAVKLGVSPKTVQNFIDGHLFRKLGTYNRGDLIETARMLGLIPLAL